MILVCFLWGLTAPHEPVVLQGGRFGFFKGFPCVVDHLEASESKFDAFNITAPLTMFGIAISNKNVVKLNENKDFGKLCTQR